MPKQTRLRFSVYRLPACLPLAYLACNGLIILTAVYHYSFGLQIQLFSQHLLILPIATISVLVVLLWVVYLRKRTDQTDGHQYFSLEESVAQPQLSLSYQNRQWCLNADVLRDIQLLYRSRFLIILTAIDDAGKRHRLYLTARQSSSIQLRLLSGCFI